VRIIVATAATWGALLIVVGTPTTDGPPSTVTALHSDLVGHTAVPYGDLETGADLNGIVEEYCVRCHSDRRLTGNLSLEGFDVASAAEVAELSEKMISKLRVGMMPPFGSRRPAGDSLVTLVEMLEEIVDAGAARSPNPGSRVFQRLNHAEFESSVLDLLGLEVDAAEYLPPDTKSANFDNIADVQMLSPTLMSAYLNAASEVARLAVGDPSASSKETTYRIPRLASQRDRVEGAPYGSRGGVSVIHNFPADGTYQFRMTFHYSPEGYLFGRNEPGEEVEVSVNGERVALIRVDRFWSEGDPGGKGLTMETDLIAVRAGAQRVSAVFVPTERGPVDDLFSAHAHSIPDTQIGIGYGINTPPHMRDLVVKGPEMVTGVSETPTRRRIFTCRPTQASEAQPCAEEIVSRIATRAYRRPLDDADLVGLMGFYDRGSTAGGFEMGIRSALEATLASPHFVFRFEEMPEDMAAGGVYPINDADLASRLSFFLWSAPPDEELRALAARGELSGTEELLAQTRRMLADPRAEALGTRFAAQWLRLQDLKELDPDVVLYPDYELQLADAMQRETELFFYGLVRDDRPMLELLSADYTYLNERLAEHYGIPGVYGNEFRRVEYPTDRRRGILGHGSILGQTSLANRTSPVNRGKWVAEVILGSPPPPPPPDVPSLDETAEIGHGRLLTTRERMEQHRADPSCNSCHRLIDPIGLALDNFDVTGRWRIRENGSPVDVRGVMYNGTPLASPADLQRALVAMPIPILRNFTVNLMAYALGRRVEYFDMPQVRKIVADAGAEAYRVSAFVLGVVESDAFRMRQETPAADGAEGDLW
jgi:hypothetical protein